MQHPLLASNHPPLTSSSSSSSASPFRSSSMAALKSFIAVAAIAVLAGTVAAVDHTVGAPSGSWNLQSQVSSWPKGQTFRKGDNLIFTYDPSQHNVLEVSKADHDSCTTTSPISKHTTGNDTIPLTAVGSRYFICGFPQHCSGGMKIEVDTVAASSPSSPPSPSGTTPSPPTGTSPPPPPPPSGASKTTVGFGLGLGMLMLLAL